MAKSRIAGITVEIGGDTTKLQDALKNTNSTIKTIRKKLTFGKMKDILMHNLCMMMLWKN